jgi:hypothetical protein
MDYRIVEVQNRTNELFEWMYDGRPYKLLPNEKKSFIKDVADHGYIKSIFAYNPVTGGWKNKIGIVGEHDVSPLDVEESEKVELIDRTDGGVLGGKTEARSIRNPQERGPVTSFGGHAGVGSEGTRLGGTTAGAHAAGPAVKDEEDE